MVDITKAVIGWEARGEDLPGEHQDDERVGDDGDEGEEGPDDPEEWEYKMEASQPIYQQLFIVYRYISILPTTCRMQ